MGSDRKRVVVVGGGVGGLRIAQNLDKDFDVTLVEKKKEYFHNLGAPRAPAEAGFGNKLYIPYDAALKNGHIIHAEAKEISDKTVLLQNNESLTFDYLVIALGSSYNYPFKSLPDTDVAKERLQKTAEKVKKAKEIVIIGGGPVGVELAGELATEYPGKKVILIHAKDKLLSDVVSDKMRAKVLEGLTTRLHVEVLLSETAVISQEEGKEEDEADEGEGGQATIHLSNSGRDLHPDVYFYALGYKVNNDPLFKHFAASLNEQVGSRYENVTSDCITTTLSKRGRGGV